MRYQIRNTKSKLNPWLIYDNRTNRAVATFRKLKRATDYANWLEKQQELPLEEHTQ